MKKTSYKQAQAFALKEPLKTAAFRDALDKLTKFTKLTKITQFT